MPRTVLSFGSLALEGLQRFFEKSWRRRVCNLGSCFLFSGPSKRAATKGIAAGLEKLTEPWNPNLCRPNYKEGWRMRSTFMCACACAYTLCKCTCVYTNNMENACLQSHEGSRMLLRTSATRMISSVAALGSLTTVSSFTRLWGLCPKP